MNRLIKDEKYMTIALQQAAEALAVHEFPVGCVMVCDDKIVASGKRTNTYGTVNEMDHAEIVALRALLDLDETVNPADVTVYSTMEPCLMCFSTLLVNGVTKFVYSYEDVMGGGTNLPLKKLSPLYKDLIIHITAGVLREQSLELFKTYFTSSETTYLRETLLAEYTVNQPCLHHP